MDSSSGPRLPRRQVFLFLIAVLVPCLVLLAMGLRLMAQERQLETMKLLALAPDRPQDGVDLQSLFKNLTALGRERARNAAARIEQLGVNRSKHLREEARALARTRRFLRSTCLRRSPRGDFP